MINRVLEKVIPFLVKWYTKRAGLMGGSQLSFDDKDFLYAWVSHSSAQKVFDAMKEAMEKEKARTW